MAKQLNFKLKDGVEPSVLLKYGFAPKYDENTGEVKEYINKIHIEGCGSHEKYFTFVFYTEYSKGGLFRKRFYYQAWMSGFNWNDLCTEEAAEVLYRLIIDGIIEPAEHRVYTESESRE